MSEYRQSGRLIDQQSKALHQMMESVSYFYHNKDKEYLFAYMSDLITINSIAIRTIQPIPNVLVLNTTNVQYYLFTDQKVQKDLSKENIEQFLDDILYDSDNVVVSGI